LLSRNATESDLNELGLASAQVGLSRDALKDLGKSSAASSVFEIADGNRFEFAASSVILNTISWRSTLNANVVGSFVFKLMIEPDGGPVTLEVCGPVGSTNFLTAMIQDPWRRSRR
jgi:hypothetical protein